MPNSQKGFTPILILVLILTVFAAAAGGYWYFTRPIGPNNFQQSGQPLSNLVSKKEPENEPNPKIEVLATLPPKNPEIQYNILFDTHRQTTVYSIDKNKSAASSSATLMINGKPGKTYTEIKELTVSDDGKRVAYVAKEGEKEFVVVGAIEGRKKYDYIKNLRFSPDGLHIAYSAGEGKYFQQDSQFSGSYMVKQMFVVVDETEGKKYDGTFVDANVGQSYDPFFSKDGTIVAYTAIKNGKNIIVKGGKEMSDYADQNYPQFIGNSYDLIYLVLENGKYFLVAADQKQASHDYISDVNAVPFFIGKDASQIAYEAVDKDARSVIVNRLSYPLTSGVLQGLAFSGSGKYAAYYTGTWESKDLWVNGKKVGNAQPDAKTAVNRPIFSPNEQLLVYSEYNQGEQKAVIHILSADSFKKIADFPLMGFKVISLMKFSEDGKYLYFKGWHDRDIVYVTLNIEKLINKQ